MNRELIRTGYDGTSLLLAFAAGAVVGTVAALLFAPGKGAETRRRVREAAHRPAELARRVTGAVREGGAAAQQEIAEALAEAR